MTTERKCGHCDEWWRYPGGDVAGHCRLVITRGDASDESYRHWSETCDQWAPILPLPVWIRLRNVVSSWWWRMTHKQTEIPF